MPTDRALVVALIVGAVVSAPAGTRAEDAESLLLPGVDLRSIDFTVGAWCRYRVVDDAMNEADTSSVYIAVVGRERPRGEEAYWVEIESRPHRPDGGERELIRLLVSAALRRAAPEDSLHQYVRKFYIQSGAEPAEAGDLRDIKRLTIVGPDSEEEWKRTPDVQLTTPAGTFACEAKQYESVESREVPAGRVTVVQRRADRVRIWSSRNVPIFHVVKCEIERSRESRTVPPVRGIPDSGRKESKTTTVLIAHGMGARSLLTPP